MLSLFYWAKIIAFFFIIFLKFFDLINYGALLFMAVPWQNSGHGTSQVMAKISVFFLWNFYGSHIAIFVTFISLSVA